MVYQTSGPIWRGSCARIICVNIVRILWRKEWLFSIVGLAPRRLPTHSVWTNDPEQKPEELLRRGGTVSLLSCSHGSWYRGQSRQDVAGTVYRENRKDSIETDSKIVNEKFLRILSKEMLEI